MTTWEEYKKKWLCMNTCRFCRGSRMHTCTSFRCQPAYEKAERYFEDVIAKEEAGMGRKYITDVTEIFADAKSIQEHADQVWVMKDRGKSELVIKFRDEVPGMVRAAVMEQVREALDRIETEEEWWKDPDAGRTRVREWGKEDGDLIRNGIPDKKQRNGRTGTET